MAIIGFNLSKVLGERKEAASGQLNINSQINITNIKKEKVEIMKDKEVLKFDFEFVITYNPDFAKIEFKGYVLDMEEPKKASQIFKDWKTKKVDEELRLQIFNLIIRKCSVKAFSIEEELSLPTHMPFPTIKAEQQPASKK